MREWLCQVVDWLAGYGCYRQPIRPITEPVSTFPRTFRIPWGSESICYWCEEDGGCEMFTTPGQTLKVPVAGGIEGSVLWRDLYMVAQIRRCPLNKFVLSSAPRLPSGYENATVVVR